MATFRWNSATGGNWSTSGNWSRKGSPGLGDFAVINPANPGLIPFTVIDDVTAEIAAVTIGQSAGTLQIGAVPGQSVALTIDGTSTSRNNGAIVILKGSSLTLGGTLINGAGLIQADADAGFGAGLTLAGATVENGQITIDFDAEMDVSGHSVLDNVTVGLNGLLAVLDGATLELDNSKIRGGRLAASGTGQIETTSGSGGNVFDGRSTAVTIAGGTTVTATGGSTLTLEGTIHDGGAIDLVGNVPNVTTTLNIVGRVTLDGGGVVSLLQSNSGHAELSGSGFLNNYDEIDGGGQISLSMANYGTIAADGAGGGTRITIAFADVTNRGTIEATGAGRNVLIYSETVDNRHGTIGSTNGGSVTIGLSTITGGVLTGNLDAFLNPASVLDGVTIAQGGVVTVDDASQLALQDTIINRGTIAVQSSGINETDLVINPDTTLTGGGQIVLGDESANGIQSNNGVAATLTNLNNTISGAGSIGNGDGSLHLVNGSAGTILANGANPLFINTGNGVTNSGMIEATAGASLIVDDEVLNGSGHANAVWAHGGTIVFDSLLPTIAGGVMVDAGGTVEFKHEAIADITFRGSGDTVRLDDSGDFAGVVESGFGTKRGTNTIDFADMSFSGVTSAGSATFQQNPSNGILALNDGTHTALISMMGQFIAAFAVGAPPPGYNGFVLADDGSPHHGTAVSYIAPPAAV